MGVGLWTVYWVQQRWKFISDVGVRTSSNLAVVGFLDHDSRYKWVATQMFNDVEWAQIRIAGIASCEVAILPLRYGGEQMKNISGTKLGKRENLVKSHRYQLSETEIPTRERSHSQLSYPCNFHFKKYMFWEENFWIVDSISLRQQPTYCEDCGVNHIGFVEIVCDPSVKIHKTKSSCVSNSKFIGNKILSSRLNYLVNLVKTRASCITYAHFYLSSPQQYTNIYIY